MYKKAIRFVNNAHYDGYGEDETLTWRDRNIRMRQHIKAAKEDKKRHQEAVAEYVPERFLIKKDGTKIKIDP